MKTLRQLRRLRTRAPRTARRRDFDISDVGLSDVDPGPPPEAVFDRSTGPWDNETDT